MKPRTILITLVVALILIVLAVSTAHAKTPRATVEITAVTAMDEGLYRVSLADGVELLVLPTSVRRTQPPVAGIAQLSPRTLWQGRASWKVKVIR